MVEDPSKRRDERRERARSAAAEMGDARRRELGAADRREISLRGGFDGVSVPIEADPGPRAFVESPRNDFLLPVGSGKTIGEGVLPQRLNLGGWIYLRCDQRLAARVRFRGAFWMTRRIEHLPSGDRFEDRGPGHGLVVDPATWEYVDIPISDREMGNGYRYYSVDPDGSVEFHTVS